MKKIISLLSVVAMVFTLMTTVAMADENNKLYYDNVNKTDSAIAFDVMLKTNGSYKTITIQLDCADLLTSGIVAGDIKVTPYGSFSASYANRSKAVNISIASGAAITPSAPVQMCKVEIDLTNQTKDFVFGSKKFEVTIDGSTNLAGSYTDGTAGYTITKATDEPPITEKFEAKVNDGVITFENAALSDKNKEIGGKAIKLFGKNFTVKADSTSKFVITYDNKETKTFGKTAAEYLGIEGKGDATGNVTVGIIYDKEQYSADDFSIAQE